MKEWKIAFESGLNDIGNKSQKRVCEAVRKALEDHENYL